MFIYKKLSLYRPRGLQDFETVTFLDNGHMKFGMSSLCNGRLYPPANIPGAHFCWSLGRPQFHSAVGRNLPLRNLNENIGNRTRDLPSCSAVPQPAEIQRVSLPVSIIHEFKHGTVSPHCCRPLTAVIKS